MRGIKEDALQEFTTTATAIEKAKVKDTTVLVSTNGSKPKSVLITGKFGRKPTELDTAQDTVWTGHQGVSPSLHGHFTQWLPGDRDHHIGYVPLMYKKLYGKQPSNCMLSPKNNLYFNREDGPIRSTEERGFLDVEYAWTLRDNHIDCNEPEASLIRQGKVQWKKRRFFMTEDEESVTTETNPYGNYEEIVVDDSTGKTMCLRVHNACCMPVMPVLPYHLPARQNTSPRTLRE